MGNAFISLLGKSMSSISKLSNQGAGSTLPGHIALGLNKTYIRDLLQNSPMQIILIVGTNGKTTTGKILTTILEKNNKKVIQNNSGANLLNGIASSLLLHTNLLGNITANFAIFEVDENNLPLILKEITPKAIIVLDLFRDQLDRYGELDTIAKKWQEAIDALPPSTQLILNADDPLIAYLGEKTTANVSYFGLSQITEQNNASQYAADSLYCPRCSTKLIFQKIFYSHLGLWKCPHCKLARPIPNIVESYYPLSGTYNRYNTLAATLTAQILGIPQQSIQEALYSVTPAFGRQEKLRIHNREIQIFLAKNPTSFNESLRTITEKQAKHIAFILNDRVPDGRDVSWIWDIDMEVFVEKFERITISGDRCWDMGLRIDYSIQFPISNFQFPNNNQSSKVQIYENLKEAIQTAIEHTPTNETLYILPTYSAMLEVRKLLTGRKIL